MVANTCTHVYIYVNIYRSRRTAPRLWARRWTSANAPPLLKGSFWIGLHAGCRLLLHFTTALYYCTLLLYFTTATRWMQDGAALTLTANRQKLWDYQANNSRKKKYIFLTSQRRSTCTAALTLTANRNKLWDYQEKKINPKIETRNRGGVDAHGYLTEVVGIAGKKISIFN